MERLPVARLPPAGRRLPLRQGQLAARAGALSPCLQKVGRGQGARAEGGCDLRARDVPTSARVSGRRPLVGTIEKMAGHQLVSIATPAI